MGIIEYQYYEAVCDAKDCDKVIAEGHTTKKKFIPYLRTCGWSVCNRGVFCPKHSRGYVSLRGKKWC